MSSEQKALTDAARAIHFDLIKRAEALVSIERSRAAKDLYAAAATIDNIYGPFEDPGE